MLGAGTPRPCGVARWSQSPWCRAAALSRTGIKRVWPRRARALARRGRRAGAGPRGAKLWGAKNTRGGRLNKLLLSERAQKKGLGLPAPTLKVLVKGSCDDGSKTTELSHTRHSSMKGEGVAARRGRGAARGRALSPTRGPKVARSASPAGGPSWPPAAVKALRMNQTPLPGDTNAHSPGGRASPSRPPRACSVCNAHHTSQDAAAALPLPRSGPRPGDGVQNIPRHSCRQRPVPRRTRGSSLKGWV